MKTTASAFLAISFGMATIPGWFQTASAQSNPSCSVDPAQVPRYPIKTDGTVIGSMTSAQARASTEWMEHKVGIKVSPDYIDLPRVVVRVVRGQVTSETLAAVVDGHVPKPGDHVEILSRYRDPRSHCNFIPWTIGSTPALS